MSRSRQFALSGVLSVIFCLVYLILYAGLPRPAEIGAAVLAWFVFSVGVYIVADWLARNSVERG
jgi:hypothetical protein